MNSQNINKENFINFNPEVEVIDKLVIETTKGLKVIEDELPEVDREFIEEYIKEENKKEQKKKEETKEQKPEKQQKEKKQSEKNEKYSKKEGITSLDELFKEIIEGLGIFLKSKVDESLLDEVKEEIKRTIKEKGGICEIIFLEKTTKEIKKTEEIRKIITSLSYYVLLFYNNEIKFTQIIQKIKEKDKMTYLETKEKYKLLEVGDIDTFGLYEEEGNKKLFIKYKDGRIIELTNLSEDIKQALILWLKKNNLLLDLKIKYGIIGNNDLCLNLFSENIKLKFTNPYDNEIKEVWVGSFNPYKRFVPFFLKDNIFNKEQVYTFKKEFIELLKEGFKEFPKARIVISYALSCIVKDWIKDNLSLFPHLWIFSSEGGTGKSSLLHLLRILTAQKSFETAMSVAQIRNVLSVRNNVVLIDDIESFGGTNDIKRIVTSLLKVSATDNITITLGDGDTFTLSTPLAVTSNHTPKEVLYTDDALLQRLLLFNLNKGEIREEWLKKIRDFKLFPQYNNPYNSELAITFYIVNKINKDFSRETILEKLTYFKDLVYEALTTTESTQNLIKQGFKIIDGRFIDILANLILGDFLFSKIFEVDVNLRKDVITFAKILIENNEAYRGESILDDILLTLIENHTLEYLGDEKEIIVNTNSLMNITNIPGEIPALIKSKDRYIIILTNKYRKKVISEIKDQINKNYNTIKMNEDIKSIGGIKKKTRFSKREITYSDDKGLSLSLKSGEVFVSVYEIPSILIKRLKKELLNYIEFDFDEGSIYIKEELKKGEKNEEN